MNMFLSIICIFAGVVLGMGACYFAQRKRRQHMLELESKIKQLDIEIHLTERKKLEEINTLTSAHYEEVRAERDKAFMAGLEKAKAEYEASQKQFSITARPFVDVTINDKMFSKESFVETGVIYQLLINGFPAFDAYRLVEKKERISEVSQEKIMIYSDQAIKLLEAAAKTYVSVKSAFSPIPEVIINLPNASTNVSEV